MNMIFCFSESDGNKFEHSNKIEHGNKIEHSYQFSLQHFLFHYLLPLNAFTLWICYAVSYAFKFEFYKHISAMFSDYLFFLL